MDNNLQVCNVSDDVILPKLIIRGESDKEELIDCSQNKTPISPADTISYIRTLQDFLPTVPNVSVVHLNVSGRVKYIYTQMSFAGKLSKQK